MWTSVTGLAGKAACWFGLTIVKMFSGANSCMALEVLSDQIKFMEIHGKHGGTWWGNVNSFVYYGRWAYFMGDLKVGASPRWSTVVTLQCARSILQPVGRRRCVSWFGKLFGYTVTWKKTKTKTKLAEHRDLVCIKKRKDRGDEAPREHCVCSHAPVCSPRDTNFLRNFWDPRVLGGDLDTHDTESVGRDSESWDFTFTLQFFLNLLVYWGFLN